MWNDSDWLRNDDKGPVEAHMYLGTSTSSRHFILLNSVNSEHLKRVLYCFDIFLPGIDIQYYVRAMFEMRLANMALIGSVALTLRMVSLRLWCC